MAVAKKEDWFFIFIRFCCKDRVMARGMEAENNFGTGRMFETEALITDGNAAVGADLKCGPNTPNVRPPRAARGLA